jgi:hypothetical protein
MTRAMHIPIYAASVVNDVKAPPKTVLLSADSSNIKLVLGCDGDKAAVAHMNVTEARLVMETLKVLISQIPNGRR